MWSSHAATIASAENTARKQTAKAKVVEVEGMVRGRYSVVRYIEKASRGVRNSSMREG